MVWCHRNWTMDSLQIEKEFQMQFLPLSFFRWWEASWISSVVNAAQWYFAIIETIHIVAFTILLGTIFIVNLRVLGFGLRRQSSVRLPRMQ